MDTWVWFERQPWPEPGQGGQYREVITHLASYAERLVLMGSTEVAARAARLLIDHGPMRPTSRMAIAQRFPEREES